MDSLRYAEASAVLLNAEIHDVSDLRAVLPPDLLARATDRDCHLLRRFQRALRPVFDAAATADAEATLQALNAVLAEHPLTVQVTQSESGARHLDVAPQTTSVAARVINESLLGLTGLVTHLGPGRLGVCEASPCTRVFVDVSPNQSRRYCSDRCCSRANVAAYRARRKQVAATSTAVSA